MKKHRNILKYFITIVQTFILALPLTSLVFNAVFHHLGLFNLSQSVSGNQEASVTESTFINEDNNINNYALKSLYDFNYLNTGNEITTYEYTEAYPTNYLESIDDIIYGNTYYWDFTDDYIVTYLYARIKVISIEYFTFNGSTISYSGDLNVNVIYNVELDDSFTLRIRNEENTYTVIQVSLEDVYLGLVFQFVQPTFFNDYEEDFNTLINQGWITDYQFGNRSLYTQTETTTTIVDIPSFIEATDGLTYDEIIDNNYVNTHLLLNLDIVGLFTNNLSGNIYIMLWLNYFLNYILTFMVVFLAFDVILYFIFIIRKILDRSVEYTDRKEF